MFKREVLQQILYTRTQLFEAGIFPVRPPDMTPLQIKVWDLFTGENRLGGVPSTEGELIKQLMEEAIGMKLPKIDKDETVRLNATNTMPYICMVPRDDISIGSAGRVILLKPSGLWRGNKDQKEILQISLSSLRTCTVEDIDTHLKLYNEDALYVTFGPLFQYKNPDELKDKLTDIIFAATEKHKKSMPKLEVELDDVEYRLYAEMTKNLSADKMNTLFEILGKKFSLDIHRAVQNFISASYSFEDYGAIVPTVTLEPYKAGKVIICPSASYGRFIYPAKFPIGPKIPAGFRDFTHPTKDAIRESLNELDYRLFIGKLPKEEVEVDYDNTKINGD